MEYPKEAIVKLARLLEGDVSALNWLADKGYKDLVIAGSGICGNDTAVATLKKGGNHVLSAFVETVNGDQDAFKWLTANKHFTWAATANAGLKDKGAMKWLQKFKLNHFEELAVAIKKRMRRNDDDATGAIYKIPR